MTGTGAPAGTIGAAGAAGPLLGELDRALESTLGVLRRVRTGQLTAATPCASWNVGDLINHFLGSARWWAAMIDETPEGAAQDFAAGDYVAAYEESGRIVRAAYSAEGALERPVRLDLGVFPGQVLCGLAAIEQFTHGWDLARATGQSTDLDPGLAEGLLVQARLAVTDAFRGPDGVALFGPERPAPAGVGPADRLAAFLGRALTGGSARQGNAVPGSAVQEGVGAGGADADDAVPDGGAADHG